jgi:hypothetical protein
VKSRGIQSIEVGGRLLQAPARVGEPMMLRDLASEAGMTGSLQRSFHRGWQWRR